MLSVGDTVIVKSEVTDFGRARGKVAYVLDTPYSTRTVEVDLDNFGRRWFGKHELELLAQDIWVTLEQKLNETVHKST